MAFYQDMPWHAGEEGMHQAMRVPAGTDNPTIPALSPQLGNQLQVAPLIAIGTLDKNGRPWTTLLGGEPGFARSLGGGIVGIRTVVTGKHDPVVEELVGKSPTGEVVREEGRGRMVGGLTIDLEKRKRVKMYGRMLAGALSSREDEVTGHNETVAEVQLVFKVEQSLGNCPKYLNSKHIVPASSKPELLDDQAHLSQRAANLLERADLFFISSSQHDRDMDTNYRGGPPGFVRIVSDEESGTVICWPEYSGNRLYQTLGNLYVNPVAGLCVPDFENGDMLYITGKTDILIGKEAHGLLPRSNLVVKLTITSARYVAGASPFRGVEGLQSPYNPSVRYLASEKRYTKTQDRELQQATLLSQTKLTPTISRFRFALENAASYKTGQYVMLDLSDHLDIGYSHMRDDDPRSLNDDFVRTFTVSSPPGSPPHPTRELKDDEFEITIRRAGTVTDFLFRHEGSKNSSGTRSSGLEVGVKGFDGGFEVKQHSEETICYIGAGVGITPLLPSLGTLEYSRLMAVWTLRSEDLGLVHDVLNQHPQLASRLRVYITNGTPSDTEQLDKFGVDSQLRRLQKSDVESMNADKYYLSTAVSLRKQLEEWLPGKALVSEYFNF
ncbi:hypothetical protein LTR08_002106 [Meristemomyces frigidus]|nr:hypothetical protein LTR08_002106 [Meristemomyces frigidus]